MHFPTPARRNKPTLGSSQQSHQPSMQSMQSMQSMHSPANAITTAVLRRPHHHHNQHSPPLPQEHNSPVSNRRFITDATPNKKRKASLPHYRRAVIWCVTTLCLGMALMTNLRFDIADGGSSGGSAGTSSSAAFQPYSHQHQHQHHPNKQPIRREFQVVKQQPEPMTSLPLVVLPTDSIYLQPNITTPSKKKVVWDFSPIVLEDYQLVFFAMPPATLWKKLFRRMMGFADWNTLDPHNADTNGLVYLKDLSRSKAAQIIMSPNYTRAMFIRDPLERFYTVYQDAILAKGGDFVRQVCCRLLLLSQQQDNSKRDLTAADNCFQGPNMTPEYFLALWEETQCQDVRWATVTERLEDKYWPFVDFVGHWDHVDRDSQTLLEQLGVWNLFGASGWGKDGHQSFSSQLYNMYQPTRRKLRMKSWLEDEHPDREALIRYAYRQDYQNPKLGLSTTTSTSTTTLRQEGGYSSLSKQEISTKTRPKTKKTPPDPATLLVQRNDYIYFKELSRWDASPVVLEKYKLIFFTIPKNACTTWKMLFRRMAGKENFRDQDEKKGLPHDPKRNGLTYLWSYPIEEANRMMIDPTFTRAIFVRDPKERFLSAYLDKALSFAETSANFMYRKCCRNTTRNEVVREELACSRKFLSPDDFLDLIEECMDQHWLPQHYRFEAKYWPYINFVGNQDTIAEDAKRLLEQIGAWDEYGASGWGSHSWHPIFHKSSHLAQTHVTDSKNKYSEYMTPELERRVEDYYAVDYENPKLGFSKNRSEISSQETRHAESIVESLKNFIDQIA